MDIRRILLYLALALVGVSLWTAWKKEFPAQPAATQQTQQVKAPAATSSSSSGYTPPTFQASKSAVVRAHKKTSGVTAQQAKGGQLISVKTDVLDVKINTLGGNLVDASLVKYPVSLKQKNTPIQILNKNLSKLYVAQSGLTNTELNKTTKFIQYSAPKLSYQLNNSQNLLTVTLTGKTQNGLSVVKTYVFHRKKYAVDVDYKITNTAANTWIGSVYYQLTRRNAPHKHSFHSVAYNGGAISSSEEPYEKLKFSKMDEHNLNRNVQGGWVAMQQQYFLSTWVPVQSTSNHFYSHVMVPPGTSGKTNIYTLGYVSPEMTLKPQSSVSSSSTFYVGPEIAQNLKPIAKGLDLTIDYGWLWPISKVIFWVMEKIHHVVGNWGWSIILVTLLIKVMFYWFSGKSYKSMAKMRRVQPQLAALKERHGGDKQAMGKATMEFYKKEKINPMGGCLPMLVQIPVFIALYYVLIESVQLRQAPFIFWIHDLSMKDPYYVLPILMGISMFLQQKLSPPPPDPTQAKMMMFLPVVFTVFFLSFPAGLVLYWLTNNCLSITQQWYVMKTYDPKAEKEKQKQKKYKKKKK